LAWGAVTPQVILSQTYKLAVTKTLVRRSKPRCFASQVAAVDCRLVVGLYARVFIIALTMRICGNLRISATYTLGLRIRAVTQNHGMSACLR